MEWPRDAAAAAAAAVRAHGLGDRKELSASRKQESSCSHYSQDLERSLPGKSFRHPTQLRSVLVEASDLLKTNHRTDTEWITLQDCDDHLRVSGLSVDAAP